METTKISLKAITIINMVNNAINKSKTGVSFVGVRNYKNQYNEVSNNLINIGISYEKAKQKDIEFLGKINLSEYEFKSSFELLEQAKNELINAFIKPNENRSNGQKDAYTHIANGLKVHNETGLIYIYGYRESKKVLEAGVYPIVNSKPITIAKNELRKLLKTGKFTQYCIESGNVIKMNGEVLEF